MNHYTVYQYTSIQCTSVHISVYSPLYGKWQRMRETESLKCNLFFPLSFSFHLKCSPGFLLWVVRGLLCRALQEPNGRTVLVTGCDTGIGHEVAGHLITHLSFCIKYLINLINMSPVIKVASFPKNWQSQPKVARHLDSLGFTVFAGCLDTASFLWVVENCRCHYDVDDDNVGKMEMFSGKRRSPEVEGWSWASSPPGIFF